MTVLHLGCVDLPYVQDAAHTVPAAPKPTKSGKPRKARVRKRSGPVAANSTTGDVAQLLEDKYHIMEIFTEVHEEDIDEDIGASLARAIENMMDGKPMPADPYAQAEEDIEQRFREFLDNKEMDETGTPGVPTTASLRGVNHRLKIKRGQPRPSFIDSGLYQSSARAWTDTPGSESEAEGRTGGVT